MKHKQKKNLNKFIATMALMTMTATAMVAPTATPSVVAAETGIAVKNLTFTDVNSRYREAVEFVVSKGVQGYSPTKFGSYDQIKRVDAAIILAKVLELDIDNAPVTSFTDVPARGQKYVNALYEAGITSGKNKTQFGSNDLITRGEMAVWITRAFNLKGSEKVSFTDVSKNYASAVSALVENKVANGFSETTFGTTTALIRGDFAVLMHRAATLNENGSDNGNNGDSSNNKFSINYEFGNDSDQDIPGAVFNNGVLNFVGFDACLVIGFNQPLDWEKSLKPENFTIDGKTPVKISPDEEYNAIWLSLGEESIKESKQYDVKVQNIVSAKGEKLDTYTTKEFLYENIKPYLTEATVINNTTIRVTFSEPVTGYQSYPFFKAFTVNDDFHNTIGMKSVSGQDRDTQYDILLRDPIDTSKVVLVECSGTGNLFDDVGNDVRECKVYTR